jgi:hypothetical protein
VTERIDYGRVIHDLEAKRSRMNAEFDAAIRALTQIAAMEGASNFQATLYGLSSAKTANTAAPPKPYSTGSMVDMAIKHLTSVGGGPVPNLRLAKALDDGGFPHKSKNFPNTLNSILHRRRKTVGDVRKTARGWEIATASVALTS